MPRRVKVPASDELFRPTVVPTPGRTSEPAADTETGTDTEPVPGLAVVGAQPARPAPRTGSGRVRHEEKMTVYVTSEELLDLEDARLALRRTHRIAVDRGRLVRAAVALALADLESNGADSALVRRLAED